MATTKKATKKSPGYSAEQKEMLEDLGLPTSPRAGRTFGPNKATKDRHDAITKALSAKADAKVVVVTYNKESVVPALKGKGAVVTLAFTKGQADSIVRSVLSGQGRTVAAVQGQIVAR